MSPGPVPASALRLAPRARRGRGTSRSRYSIVVALRGVSAGQFSSTETPFACLYKGRPTRGRRMSSGSGGGSSWSFGATAQFQILAKIAGRELILPCHLDDAPSWAAGRNRSVGPAPAWVRGEAPCPAPPRKEARCHGAGLLGPRSAGALGATDCHWHGRVGFAAMIVYPLSLGELRVVRCATRLLSVLASAALVLLGAMSLAA